MRLLLSAVAAAALLSASLAAHADTIQETFTASGPASLIGGRYAVTTTSFTGFSPLVGTLNSISIGFTGSATSSPSNFFYSEDAFAVVQSSNGSGSLVDTFTGVGMPGQSFYIAASGTDSSGPDLASFEGSGPQSLLLIFSGQTSNVSVLNGSLTYNYTPNAVAVTPEPSSFALLGTGILGALGVARKRFV